MPPSLGEKKRFDSYQGFESSQTLKLFIHYFFSLTNQLFVIMACHDKCTILKALWNYLVLQPQQD